MFSSRHLPWLACAAVAAAGLLPALARGEAASAPAASIVAYDTGFRDAAGGVSDNEVDIAAGEEVSFSYPTGGLQHNVVFSSAQPTSCTQTAGAIILPAPPLPQLALPAGWEGTCTFNTPGTYDFVCFVHPTMTGKVVVAASATPTPSGTATPTATPTPTASPTTTPEAPPVRVEAHDFYFQDAGQASPDDHSVTVQPGDEVGFSYPSGTNAHNVQFKDAQPASCTQTAGTVLGDTPPLPKFPLPQGWSGTCRFDTPGTYTFVCSVHPEMTGTVVVPGPAPPATTSTVTRDPNPAPVPKPWATLDMPSRTAATLAAFLGRKLRMGAHCASVSSGTLVLRVSAAVAKRLKLKGTTLATAHSRCRGDNRFTVTVKPNAAARKALRHYRKTLKVTATLSLGNLRESRKFTLKGHR